MTVETEALAIKAQRGGILIEQEIAGPNGISDAQKEAAP
jgi:hypothetical protein